MCWVLPVYLSGYVIGELETQWMAVVMFFISGISGFVLRHVEYLLRTKQVIVMLFYYFQAMYFFCLFFSGYMGAYFIALMGSENENARHIKYSHAYLERRQVSLPTVSSKNTKTILQ